MAKSRRSRQVPNWVRDIVKGGVHSQKRMLKKGEEHSHSKILITKASLNPVPLSNDEQVQKSLANRKKLEKQCQKLQDKVAAMPLASEERKMLEIKLLKRRHLLTRSILHLEGPNGLLKRRESNQKRQDTKFENQKKEKEEFKKVIEKIKEKEVQYNGSDMSSIENKKTWEDSTKPKEVYLPRQVITSGPGGKNRKRKIIRGPSDLIIEYREIPKKYVKNSKGKKVQVTNNRFVQVSPPSKTYVLVDEKGKRLTESKLKLVEAEEIKNQMEKSFIGMKIFIEEIII